LRVTGETGGYETVLAGAMENIAILQVHPEYYERLKAQYDEQFYRQEVLGGRRKSSDAPNDYSIAIPRAQDAAGYMSLCADLSSTGFAVKKSVL
jgi:hypothetical protein